VTQGETLSGATDSRELSAVGVNSPLVMHDI